MKLADRNKEERFLCQLRDATAEHLRWACWVGAAIMIGFLWQDTLMSANGYKAVNIRIFGALPVSALAWYLSRNLRVRRFISYISAFFWLSYACFIAAIFIIYEPSPYGLTSSAGLGSFLLLLFGVFTFSNLLLWPSLLVGLLTLLIYTVSVVLWTEADFVNFIMGDFLTAVTLMIGAATKTLFTDRARRRIFETSELLSESYTALEQRVQERTSELQATNMQLSGEITERKRAEENLRQSFAKTRKALEATVQAISSLVETKDPYTAGHQHRVANLARTIATEMGLTTDQIDGMRISGIIHDLGKISVPSEILSMPRKLTDIEFNFIKTHTQSGYNILKDIEFPWPIARMVLEHHERMDGSGYPNGLTGENILIESRILAIADVVEAMASHRPYRPALGIDAALAEITKNKGVLYDSQVVDACLLLFNEKGYKIMD